MREHCAIEAGPETSMKCGRLGFKRRGFESQTRRGIGKRLSIERAGHPNLLRNTRSLRSGAPHTRQVPRQLSSRLPGQEAFELVCTTGKLTSALMDSSTGSSRSKSVVCDTGFWAPSGHPDQCHVCISLILLCRAWSKLDVQVIVWN